MTNCLRRANFHLKMSRHCKKRFFVGRIAHAVFRIASVQLTIGRWDAKRLGCPGSVSL
jgi:hypothetical protein